jgi:hypothetical protein
MRTGALLILSVCIAALTACGQNECDRAGDHAVECKITDLHGTEGSTSGEHAPERVVCLATVLCTDACFNAASCDALSGKDADGAKAYNDCVVACQ